MYEYKLFPAPRQVKRGKIMSNEDGTFGGTLSRQINLISGSGWEFLRTAPVPVQKRNWRGGIVTGYEDMLVFRRLIAKHAPQADTQTPSQSLPPRGPGAIRPRRVRPGRPVTPRSEIGETMEIAMSQVSAG